MLLLPGILYFVQYVVSDSLFCSDYLVSGLHGVNDSSLTASSISTNFSFDYRPKNARLYYAGDNFATPPIVGCWAPVISDAEQYIQVKFPVVTLVKSVTIQGRYAGRQHWVKLFQLLYSMDDVNWLRLNSPNGEPQLFPGNTDTNTPVRSEVDTIVEVSSLRVNPRTWHGFIGMRFDIGGCQLRKVNNTHTKFAKKPVKVTKVMEETHTVIEPMPVPTLKDCVIACHRHGTCISLTYLAYNGTCVGYNAWIVISARFSSEMAAFVNQEVLDSLGYKEGHGGAFLYNFIEITQDQSSASGTCTEKLTRLFRVDSELKMTRLQDVIDGNYILENNYNFYVSGGYSNSKWLYSDGIDEIDSALWAVDNPNSKGGHCVMLTKTGLASVDCAEKLFSICGY